MTLLHANNNNNTIATNVTTVAPDQFFVDASISIVDALNGNDTITLTNPYRNITIKGGNGNDSINLNSSLVNSVVNGGNGNDTTTIAAAGSATNTAFQSLEGNNSWIFNGASNFNSVTAGVGNDVLNVIATSADDVVLLGQGADDATFVGDVTRLNLGAGQGDDDILAVNVSASEIRGAKDNDFIALTGTLTNSTLRGGDGNDTLRVDGLVTNSLLISTLGTNRFQFGNALSTATITGGTGSDTIAVTSTGFGDAFFANASAIDVLSLASTSGAAANITAGGFAQMAGIRTIRNDSTGTAATQTLNASGFSTGISIIGNAVMNDAITAGAGADTINAGAGANTVANAGVGNDVIVHNTGGTNVLTVTGTGTVTLTASQDSARANVSTGVSATVNASTSTAAVILIGNSAADVLTGGAGADNIDGSDSNDTITGGAGADILTSGYAPIGDRLVYGALANITTQTGITEPTADTITDFGTTYDKIVTDVAGSNANFTTGANVGFDTALAAASAAFIGNNVLRYYYSTGATQTTGDFLFFEAGSGGTAADAAINIFRFSNYGPMVFSDIIA